MKMRLLTLIAALACSAGVAAAQTPAAEPDGAALYRQHCRSCHGARGVAPERMRSVYPTLKTLADSAYLARTPVDSIVAVLQHGKGKDMKSFADRLSPAEMRAVATFVKSLGGGS
jgi:cytochrome c oxidase cbb3-type subunit 3